MPYNTPKTWTTGELVTATQLNQQVSQNVSYLYDQSTLALGTAQRGGIRNLLPNASGICNAQYVKHASMTSTFQTDMHGWQAPISGAGTWTSARTVLAGTGTGPNASAYASLKMTCNAATATPTYAIVGTCISADDMYAVNPNWGTSDALGMVLSFWVRSNVTGTYVVAIGDFSEFNSGVFTAKRQWAATYTINAANTWEQKSFVIPARTFATEAAPFYVGSLPSGLAVRFCLAANTASYQTGALATNWEVPTTNRFTGQSVNLASAVNNFWEIASPQLEIGTTQTAFQALPWGTEYARASRNVALRAPGNGRFAMATSTGANSWVSDVIPWPAGLGAAQTYWGFTNVSNPAQISVINLSNGGYTVNAVSNPGWWSSQGYIVSGTTSTSMGSSGVRLFMGINSETFYNEIMYPVGP